jgi:recombination protein RecA
MTSIKETVKKLDGVYPASVLDREAVEDFGRPESARWCLDELSGRLIEISGRGDSAVLTVAMGLVAQAQRLGEPAAWITVSPDTFFPPDAARSGIDLDTLPVIRACRDRAQHARRLRSSPGSSRLRRARATRRTRRFRAKAALRAAEVLARSGAFALIVVDLGKILDLPPHALSRLKGLAHKHETALLFLTEKPSDAPSLDSLISLRAMTHRSYARVGGADGACFECGVQLLKDKRRGPGWSHAEVCSGPPGLY